MNTENHSRHELFIKAQDLYFNSKYDESLKLCLEGAQLGNIKCQRLLGWMYYTGNGCQQDLGKAFEWFSKAAESGDIEANFGIASIYYCQESYAKSFDKYRKTAELGFAPAMFRVGMMYKQGLGIDRDLSLAREFYIKAAKHGNLVAERAYVGMLLAGQEGFGGRIKGFIRLIYVILKTLKAGFNDPHSQRFMY